MSPTHRPSTAKARLDFMPASSMPRLTNPYLDHVRNFSIPRRDIIFLRILHPDPLSLTISCWPNWQPLILLNIFRYSSGHNLVTCLTQNLTVVNHQQVMQASTKRSVCTTGLIMVLPGV